MKRVSIPELLDSNSGTDAEVIASLADLRFFNQYFGGISTGCALLERAAPQIVRRHIQLLDVAAASGDVPSEARARLAKKGIQLDVTLLDRSVSHLRSGHQAVAGDALALPFRDESFDLVSCGLFAHHLSPDELVIFVNEALRVSRAAVLINDLIRHPLHLALALAGIPIYRSRLTRHDAPASVRCAYTVDEMRGLLQQTAAVRHQITRHYFFRMGVIAWKT